MKAFPILRCDLNFNLAIWYNNADSENCDYHEIRNYED